MNVEVRSWAPGHSPVKSAFVSSLSQISPSCRSRSSLLKAIPVVKPMPGGPRVEVQQFRPSIHFPEYEQGLPQLHFVRLNSRRRVFRGLLLVASVPADRYYNPVDMVAEGSNLWGMVFRSSPRVIGFLSSCFGSTFST